MPDVRRSAEDHEEEVRISKVERDILPDVRPKAMEAGGLDLLKRICAGDKDVIGALRMEKVEEIEVERNDCPDCGGRLVWNRILKRDQCECGYQGKVRRQA